MLRASQKWTRSHHLQQHRSLIFSVGSMQNLIYPIWNDHWIPSAGDGRIKNQAININYTLVYDLIDASTKTWKLEVLNHLFDEEQVILEGVVPSVFSTLSFVEAYIRENDAIKAPVYLRTRVDRVSWQTPVENVIKLNCDATYDAQSNKSFSGVICRDSARLIMASCTSLQSHVADAFIAEALACLQAVNCARDLGFSRVIVEGECLIVIKKVCSKTANVSLISPVIYYIREVAKGFEDVTFCFAHRKPIVLLMLWPVKIMFNNLWVALDVSSTRCFAASSFRFANLFLSAFWMPSQSASFEIAGCKEAVLGLHHMRQKNQLHFKECMIQGLCENSMQKRARKRFSRRLKDHVF
ncbi:hypothetical protein GQ457_07G010000 [Hibiscus cannabinus]